MYGENFLYTLGVLDRENRDVQGVPFLLSLQGIFLISKVGFLDTGISLCKLNCTFSFFMT